jgi:ankyrin repeat protein
VAKLFIKLGANVNEKDRNGCSPLFYITDVNIVQLLINNKADVNHRNNHNATPIFNYKDSNIFLLLINSGADLNARSSIDGGITLIDSVVSAYREYYLDHVKLLILRGAIFGKIDKYQAFSHLFTKEQQNAFDAFMSITNNDNDFYQMCLAYQNDIKIDIKEMDIL